MKQEIVQVHFLNKTFTSVMAHIAQGAALRRAIGGEQGVEWSRERTNVIGAGILNISY